MFFFFTFQGAMGCFSNLNLSVTFLCDEIRDSSNWLMVLVNPVGHNNTVLTVMMQFSIDMKHSHLLLPAGTIFQICLYWCCFFPTSLENPEQVWLVGLWYFCPFFYFFSCIQVPECIPFRPGCMLDRGRLALSFSSRACSHCGSSSSSRAAVNSSEQQEQAAMVSKWTPWDCSKPEIGGGECDMRSAMLLAPS